MLHVLNARLKYNIILSGFVPGKGTREQILNVRQIIERAREFQVKAYLCFVDYTKAFDKVK